MRRLTKATRDDQGVATIFLILAMPVLLVGLAFAVDTGRYVLEARSAQNSADATVLAVATDCARTGAPIADYSPYRKTGQAITPPACGSGQATITVTKPMAASRLAEVDAGEVDRSATAKWGTLGTAETVPIILSSCEFSQALLDGTTDVTWYLDDTSPWSGCSSLPGGFSTLDSNDCGVTVTADGTATGDPGADLQKLIPCITNPTAPYLPHDIIIALYDAAECQSSSCKGNGDYPVSGFAALRITGYSFNGNKNAGTLGKNCPEPTRGKYCIRGDFIRLVAQGSPGPSTNYGLTTVYLAS